MEGQAGSVRGEDEKREGNPVAGVGKLIAKGGKQDGPEDGEVRAWTSEEAQAVLRVLEEHEPSVAPLIDFLLATGCRLGEALALRPDPGAGAEPSDGHGGSSVLSSLARVRVELGDDVLADQLDRAHHRLVRDLVGLSRQSSRSQPAAW